MKTFTAYYRLPNASFVRQMQTTGELPKELSEEQFTLDFVPVMTLEANDPEDIWVFMQGENWSPNGEAREAIRSLGLYHTSMDIADVVYDHSENKYWMVEWFGFSELNIGN